MSKNNKQGLSTYKMAGRIADRADNKIYRKEFIYDILKMYMDECRKAMIRGERVQLSGIGTLIPEVKTCKNFNLPICNKEGGNPPYTRLRMTRTDKLGAQMNQKLNENVANGIYGLEKTPFDKQQMTILKRNGVVPEDAETDLDDGEE